MKFREVLAAVTYKEHIAREETVNKRTPIKKQFGDIFFRRKESSEFEGFRGDCSKKVMLAFCYIFMIL